MDDSIEMRSWFMSRKQIHHLFKLIAEQCDGLKSDQYSLVFVSMPARFPRHRWHIHVILDVLMHKRGDLLLGVWQGQRVLLSRSWKLPHAEKDFKTILPYAWLYLL